VGKQQLRLSTYRSITNLPDSGWSFSMRGHTEYQPQPPGSASEISIRDRSHTPCEWGQNWGHNSIFSGCNYCPRTQSKCFLAIRTVSEANCKTPSKPRSRGFVASEQSCAWRRMNHLRYAPPHNPQPHTKSQGRTQCFFCNTSTQLP
jgi:hypothetical protein